MQHATATPLIRHRLEKREDSLSPHAARSAGSRGRAVREEPSPMRTEFQRDRDRIVHSKAFRRLKHKTQVFIAPQGDHYVTRLTHTFEVAQIARSISRALDLNEDLTEAIALGHDLGHTPFGHIGEDELNSLLAGGFRHNRQSLRVVDTLEKGGRGLNLTSEVRQGIVSHSKPRGDFLDSSLTEGLTAEAQVVRISDAVAYLNHDLADAFRAGVLDRGSLPGEVVALGDRHSQRINMMVTDIVQSSWALSGLGDETLDGPPAISMSPGVRKAVNVLREFMFQRVYVPEDAGEEGRTARKIVRLLHGHLTANPSEVPAEFHGPEGAGRPNVVDYVAGMTDRYAIRTAESIEPGTAGIFLERLV